MKRDTVLSLLTKDKWELPTSNFNALVETIEELQYQQLPFNEQNVYDYIPPGFREQVMTILEQVGIDKIKDEIAVRLFLNGYFESDLFVVMHKEPNEE